MSIEEVMAEVRALREDVASLRRELQFGLPHEVYCPPEKQAAEPQPPVQFLPGSGAMASGRHFR